MELPVIATNWTLPYLDDSVGFPLRHVAVQVPDLPGIPWWFKGANVTSFMTIFPSVQHGVAERVARLCLRRFPVGGAGRGAPAAPHAPRVRAAGRGAG